MVVLGLCHSTCITVLRRTTAAADRRASLGRDRAVGYRRLMRSTTGHAVLSCRLSLTAVVCLLRAGDDRLTRRLLVPPVVSVDVDSVRRLLYLDRRRASRRTVVHITGTATHAGRRRQLVLAGELLCAVALLWLAARSRQRLRRDTWHFPWIFHWLRLGRNGRVARLLMSDDRRWQTMLTVRRDDRTERLMYLLRPRHGGHRPSSDWCCQLAGCAAVGDGGGRCLWRCVVLLPVSAFLLE